ncbi:hypothetical protein T4B_14523, partial [Trichinella pseudospiralis]
LNLNHFVTQNRDQILLAVEDIPKTLSQHLSACVSLLCRKLECFRLLLCSHCMKLLT